MLKRINGVRENDDDDDDDRRERRTGIMESERKRDGKGGQKHGKGVRIQQQQQANPGKKSEAKANEAC